MNGPEKKTLKPSKWSQEVLTVKIVFGHWLQVRVFKVTKIASKPGPGLYQLGDLETNQESYLSCSLLSTQVPGRISGTELAFNERERKGRKQEGDRTRDKSINKTLENDHIREIIFSLIFTNLPHFIIQKKVIHESI